MPFPGSTIRFGAFAAQPAHLAAFSHASVPAPYTRPPSGILCRAACSPPRRPLSAHSCTLSAFRAASTSFQKTAGATVTRFPPLPQTAIRRPDSQTSTASSSPSGMATRTCAAKSRSRTRSTASARRSCGPGSWLAQQKRRRLPFLYGRITFKSCRSR